MTAIACRILVIILGLAISGLAMSDSKLSTKDDSYYERARLWQNGWTLVFSSSIASQLYTLSVPESDPGKHFDARISMVTSGSGLLSILLNPLPGSWDAPVNHDPAAWEATLRRSRLEVERRRSVKFKLVLLGEQVLAAGAIAGLDQRPQDATRRFLLGMLTSALFVYTTPWHQSWDPSAAYHIDFLPAKVALTRSF